MDTVVVLPDPFGPSSPSTDPAGTARLSPSSACTSPKAFRRRLRDTATAFDAKLRAGLADADLATLSTLLGHLAANARAGEAAPPWAGLADRHPE